MSLSRGLFNQYQVTRALILRETRTRFGNHYLGYLWAFLDPILIVFLFCALFYVGNRSAPNGMEAIGFLATGIVPYYLFRSTSSQAMSSVKGNKSLLFYPQIRPLDLIISRVLLEFATYTGVVVVILGGNALIQGELVFDDILVTISGFALAGLLGTSLGLLLCPLSILNNTVEKLTSPLLRPLFWTSGLFFTASELPSHVRDILLFNPVLHTTELMRTGWFVSYDSEYVSISYVLSWCLALSFAGLSLERVARRRIEVA